MTASATSIEAVTRGQARFWFRRRGRLGSGSATTRAQGQAANRRRRNGGRRRAGPAACGQGTQPLPGTCGLPTRPTQAPRGATPWPGPPKAPRVTITEGPTPTIERDEHGNARGGIRLPSRGSHRDAPGRPEGVLEGGRQGAARRVPAPAATPKRPRRRRAARPSGAEDEGPGGAARPPRGPSSSRKGGILPFHRLLWRTPRSSGGDVARPTGRPARTLPLSLPTRPPMTAPASMPRAGGDPPQPGPSDGCGDTEVVTTDERGKVTLEHRDPRARRAAAQRWRRCCPTPSATRGKRHRVGSRAVRSRPGGWAARMGKRPVHRQRHRGDADDRRAGVLGRPVARCDDYGLVTVIPEMLQDAKHRVRHAVDLRKKALSDDSDLHDAQHDESRRKRLGRATNTTSRSRSATVNEPRYRGERKRSPLVHPDADRDATRRSTVECT